ncbi:MAG: Heavy-metal resistance protein [Labilithrix sp.]|nr:Heavy-metal resistance protein [Labilithrix sp.]
MTMTSFRIAPLALAVGLVGLVACANERHPLPGDSISTDGGIKLSPPRLSTAPTEAREAQAGLGPIEARLFPPELVMEHQGELAITAEQKQALLAETERGQSAVLRLQWELQGEKEKLVKLLDADHVDETKVQESAARVMDRESKVKAAHLGMLVRVKNLLTPEQQAKLRDIRAGVAVARVSDAGADSGARRTDAAP